uniref:lycopene cyclase domain-containing protein n=1 Tax=Actinomadura sp. CA-154981 TaxID=3240037 RepID=UPI003F499386
MKFGMLGGLAGLAAELFYFRDYWRPPSLTGTATFSPEDFFAGFGITALSFMVYPLLARQKFEQSNNSTGKRLYAGFFVVGTIALCFGSLIMGINSVLISSVAWLCFSAVMLVIRRDLIRVAAVSAGAVTGYFLVVYLLLFNIVAPEFWREYWLLSDSKWGITFLGNVPLTEMVWYLTWALFGGISYPFASGKVLVDIPSPAEPGHAGYPPVPAGTGRATSGGQGSAGTER